MKDKKKKKHLETNKVLCVIGMLIIGIIGVYAILHFCAMERIAVTTNATVTPSAEVPVAAITTIFAFFLTYCGYNGVLKNSRNKYKVDENGIPYKQQVERWYQKMKEKEAAASDEVNDNDT